MNEERHLEHHRGHERQHKEHVELHVKEQRATDAHMKHHEDLLKDLSDIRNRQNILMGLLVILFALLLFALAIDIGRWTLS